ncbi:MAG: O-acetyl-ADP-ribose deacetylase [Lachnospiraceae bacterium]|nr:O-acetyl-ADP-ribose deacetylase [Lachnospiraceae bacterium]
MKNEIKFMVADITTLEVDAIVNAANKTLLGGGGVDGAIHAAAGSKLLEECKKLGGCETGQAKITGGYDLPAKYIIHTVGPVYTGSSRDAAELYSCYYGSLDLAAENDIHSIAFPGISTGVYGYPKPEAAMIAVKAVVNWLDEHKDYGMQVNIVCFSNADYKVYEQVVRGDH